jgi:hypothetical protein
MSMMTLGWQELPVGSVGWSVRMVEPVLLLVAGHVPDSMLGAPVEPHANKRNK